MIFFLTYFIFSITLNQNQAQVELNGGGGYAFKGTSLAFEANFDAISDTLATGFSLPFYVYTKNEQFNFQNQIWNEPSDFAHIIRYLSWRNSSGDFKTGFNLGEEFEITLGSGLVVNQLNFMSVFFHPQTGVSFYFKNKQIKSSIIIDNFVDPKFVGGDFSYIFNKYFELGFTTFTDFSTPYIVHNSNEEIDYNEQTDTISPTTSQNIFYGSVFAVLKPLSFLEIGFETGSFNALKTSQYGITGFAKINFKTSNFKLSGIGGIGAGGKHFLPFALGPFYLERKFFVDLKTSENIFYYMKNQDVSAPFTYLKLNFTSKNINLRVNWQQNTLFSVISLSSEIMFSNKFVLALYGAVNNFEEVIFATQLRFALNKNWFLWSKAKRLYSFANAFPTAESVYVGGLGFRFKL